MNRRKLLAGAGAVSVLPLDWAYSQPCPPILDGGGAAPICPAPGQDSDLASLAQSLSPGEWSDFPEGRQSSFNTATLEWQSNFYHDAARGIAHLLGKPANANSSWQHQYYSLATGTWTNITSASEINQWSYAGHIYGNTAFDESTGDLYQTVGIVSSADSKKAWRYRSATSRWDRRAPENGTYTTTALNDTSNGAAWHPNLFGPNDPGLVIDQQIVTLYWRKSTDAMYEQSHSSNAFGRKEGIGIYWAARDSVIVGGSTGDQLALVEPNGGSTPRRTALPSPPITTSGQSSLGNNFGSLHVHPGDPDKLLIVETVGNRAWVSDDGISWQGISNHPFNRIPRVVCSLRGGLGCLWAVGRDSENFSQVWKPPI